MKRFNNWELGQETYEQQSAAGRHNPCLQVRIDGGPRLTIGAGNADSVDVFREGALYFVVSVNHGLEYCGLEVFDANTGDQLGETFLQTDYEIAEILGKRGVDLAPMTIAKRLADYALA